jgi:hypothetical protein
LLSNPALVPLSVCTSPFSSTIHWILL